MNINSCIIFCRYVFILLVIYPGVKLLVWVQFHWNNLTDLFSKARKPFYLSTSSMIYEASNCSHLCQHLVWSVSIIIITIIIVISILVDVKKYSSTVMICISLLSNDDEYLLCFVAIYITSFDTANCYSRMKNQFSSGMSTIVGNARQNAQP